MPIVSRKGAATSQGFGQFSSGATGDFLYAWGANFYYEAFNGRSIYANSPVLVSAYSDYAVINRGYINNVFVKPDGTLWVNGDNNYGVQGNSTTSTTYLYSPVQVGTATNWATAASGVYNWIAIKTDGTMWACGYNTYGSLGIFTNTARSSPVQVGTATNWSKIVMAYYDSYAITTSGQLYAWGYNVYGQVGNNSTAQTSSPVQVGGLTGWTDVISQQYTVLGLRGTSLYVWGEGRFGQVGDFTVNSRSSPVQITGTWSKIGSTDYTSFGIKSDGTLWSWGQAENYGETGQGNKTNISSPVQIGALTDWADVTNAYYGGFAVRTNGSIYRWGYGGGGGFGDLTFTDASSPVLIGTYTSPTLIRGCAYDYYNATLPSGGSIVWGVGTPGTTFLQNPGSNSPVLTSLGKAYTSAVMGSGAFVGITKTGKRFTAAMNNLYGSAGNNTILSQYTPTASTFTKVVVCGTGAGNSAGIKSDGTLWTWGFNFYGQLGQNDRVNRSSPVQVGTATNWADVVISQPGSTIALKTDGTLWAIGGYNVVYGGLGLNDVIHRSSPVQIGSATNWTSIVPGYYSTWAFAGTSLYRWGYNGYGQLGSGNEQNFSSPVLIGTGYSKIAGGIETTAFIKTDNTLWTCGNNTYGRLGSNAASTSHRSSPVQVGSLSDWSQVQAGVYGFCSLKTNGTLWAWGYNAYGQVGDGTFIDRSSPIQIGSDTNWKNLAQTNSQNTYTYMAFK